MVTLQLNKERHYRRELGAAWCHHVWLSPPVVCRASTHRVRKSTLVLVESTCVFSSWCTQNKKGETEACLMFASSPGDLKRCGVKWLLKSLSSGPSGDTHSWSLLLGAVRADAVSVRPVKFLQHTALNSPGQLLVVAWGKHRLPRLVLPHKDLGQLG
jgi:hypothetical protein